MLMVANDTVGGGLDTPAARAVARAERAGIRVCWQQHPHRACTSCGSRAVAARPRGRHCMACGHVETPDSQ